MSLLNSFLSLISPSASGVRRVQPAEAAQRVADGNAVLIDVREPDEWAETGVAAPAALLPLSDLDGDRKQWKKFLEKTATRSWFPTAGRVTARESPRNCSPTRDSAPPTQEASAIGRLRGCRCVNPKNPHARRRSGLVNSDPVSTPWMQVSGISATPGMILCMEPSRTVFW
jgi:hypothetical protein